MTVEGAIRDRSLPSIEHGVLVRSSPSSIEAAELCAVKWYYDKVQHLPRKPPGKGATIGTQGHAEIEHYLGTGEDVRGRIAQTGYDLLAPYVARAPFNGGDLMIEGALEDPELFTPSGVQIRGFYDLLVPNRYEPEIIDHKFRKDLERYGATEEKLKEGTQGLVYMKWAASRWGSVKAVRFSHHEHQTEGRLYARRTSVLLPVAEINEKFDRIATFVDTQMAPLVQLKVEDVPYNDEACGAFGGCDYASVCPHSPASKWLRDITPPKEQKPMAGLLSKQLAAVATPSTPVEVAAPSPAVVPAPAPAPAQVTVPGGIPAWQGESNKRYVVKGVEATLQVKTPGLVFFTTDDKGALTCGPADLIVPVVAAPPAPAPVVAAPAPVSIVPPDVAPPAPVAAPVAAVPVLADIQEPEVKAKKAKPSKAAAEVEAKVAEILQATPEPLVLLVDCISSGGTKDLTGYIQAKADKLAESAKVKDIRIAPKDNPLAYGGWKGALAKAVRDDLPTGACFIAKTDLSECVIDALIPHAFLVIRPLR